MNEDTKLLIRLWRQYERFVPKKVSGNIINRTIMQNSLEMGKWALKIDNNG